MKYLLRKEIALFFSSAMGYVIVAVWLLAVSLMLWVFGGDYNIPDSGYASLRPFFTVRPGGNDAFFCRRKTVGHDGIAFVPAYSLIYDCII
jgi:hypothetical protein